MCIRDSAVTALFTFPVFAVMGMTTVITNPQDLAPLHAGKVTGLVFTFADLGAVFAPMVVGVMTNESSTADDWQNVFFLAAAMYAVGAVVYALFGSGERQSWAD